MISTKVFGILDNKDIVQFTLQNELIKCSSINLGATITELIVTNKNGESQNIVLNLPSVEAYLQNSPFYLGVICGRYANRIANAKFSINNTTYELAKNCGNHHLHGGIQVLI